MSRYLGTYGLSRQPGPEPRMLASDSDRDAAAGLLSEALAEGRLSAVEHTDRVRAAYTARTRADLAGLTSDLPVPADHPAESPAAELDGPDRCLLCALLVLCPPAGICWLLAARRRSRLGRGQRAGSGGGHAEDR